MATDQDLALHLWQSFRRYLEVEIDPKGADGKPRVVLKNTAPIGPDHPRIVFEEITLTTTRGGSTVSRNVGVLVPGQTMPVPIEYDRVEDASATVEAQVSRRQFFLFTKHGQAPDNVLAPAVRKWLAEYEKFGLLERLALFLKSLPEVTPDTTLRDLQTLETGIDRLSDIVREAQKVVGDITALEERLRPWPVLRAYIDALAANTGKLKTAAQSRNTEQLRAAREAALAVPVPTAEVKARVAALKGRFGQ